MCEGALMTKFAVTLDEPSADALRLPGFIICMGERTRDPCGTGAYLEELARDMGEILSCKGDRISKPKIIQVDKPNFW
jgi:hypothetical protein